MILVYYFVKYLFFVYWVYGYKFIISVFVMGIFFILNLISVEYFWSYNVFFIFEGGLVFIVVNGWNVDFFEYVCKLFNGVLVYFMILVYYLVEFFVYK